MGVGGVAAAGAPLARPTAPATPLPPCVCLQVQGLEAEGGHGNVAHDALQHYEQKGRHAQHGAQLGRKPHGPAGPTQGGPLVAGVGGQAQGAAHAPGVGAGQQGGGADRKRQHPEQQHGKAPALPAKWAARGHVGGVQAAQGGAQGGGEVQGAKCLAAVGFGVEVGRQALHGRDDEAEAQAGDCPVRDPRPKRPGKGEAHHGGPPHEAARRNDGGAVAVVPRRPAQGGQQGLG